MKIIIDAMGGDFAPAAPVEGAVQARKKFNAEIVLVGREEEIRRELERLGHTDVPQGITIVDAREVIEISDDAASAFKKKKDSSMTVGLTMLRDGAADGFISAGSTGALFSGATLVVKRIRGLRRAALAPVIPTYGGNAVLIDSGANADCTSEYLLQFAYLGSFYASHVMGLAKPRVALLNIGAESEKGDALRLETYARLMEAHEKGDINFIGNIEAKEAVLGGCDVIVADGFAGNVLLKTVEGTAKFMGNLLKGMFKTNLRTKIAYLLLKKEFSSFKSLLDPNRVGGTPILGISKPVLKAHGSASAEAFCNAVGQAVAVAESGIAEDIAANIDKMKLARGEEQI